MLLLNSTVVVGNNSNIELTQIYYEDWFPGLALGFPGFISAGNFSATNRNEILFISSIPDKSDVITLCDFSDNELKVLGSKDRDFSSVFQITTADVSGDGILELLVCEDWVNDVGSHLGSHHTIYRYKNSTFDRLESFYFYNPEIILDLATTFNLDNDTGKEIVYITWDQSNKTELVRIYDFNNNNLESKTNLSFTINLEFSIRSILFTQAGNFDADENIEILSISKWSEISTPANPQFSFEMYEYIESSNQLQHDKNGSINIEGYRPHFSVADVNLDGIDELILNLDKNSRPELRVYNLQNEEPEIEYFISRITYDESSEEWSCEEIFSFDIDNNLIPDIIIAESLYDYTSGFAGRIEIIELVEGQLERKTLQDIDQPPVGFFVEDIDSISDFEIISVFNNYDLETFVTKGGIEIWSTGSRKGGFINLSRFGPILGLMIIALIPLIKKSSKKLEK